MEEDSGMSYWDNISAIQKAQEEKGIRSYGQRIEDNHSMSIFERLMMLEEELVDALMYIEWIKEYMAVWWRTEDGERYRWHDLRKNPEDVPEELEKVYVYFEYFRYGDFNCMYKDYGVSYQIGGMFHFVNGSSGWRKLKIIAWKYIEPFEEVE